MFHTTNNMIETLAENVILNGETQYNEALTKILKSAKNELLIYDNNLSRGGFSSLEKHDLLQDFITKNPASRLEILLQEDGYFLQQCPKLDQLFKVYHHKISIHLTDRRAKEYQTGFVLADRQHFIKRIHFEHARFKFSINNPQESAVLYCQFLEISACAPKEISVSTLGL